MDYVLRKARVVGPRAVTVANVWISEGRIAAIGGPSRRPGARTLDAEGLIALPGFVDVHVHGGLGFDATLGRYDAKRDVFDASPERFQEALPVLMRSFARSGVTRCLLSTLAAPMPNLEHAFLCLADYAEGPTNGQDGARLEGIFPEGTFVKNPAYAGAQNPENFHEPSREVFARLQAKARGQIRYINIVPEYGRPAEALTRAVTRQGVTVGMAHTFADADQVARCVRAGLRSCQHFLNGPTGSSFKPFGGGNVVEAVLSTPAMYAELICDGWHVNPRYVRDVMARKGMRRVVLVSDAMFIAGAPGVREFSVGGIRGTVHPSGQYLQVVGKTQTLFGSTLTLSRAFANALNWLTGSVEGIWTGRHRPMPLDTALVQTAWAAATNPADLIGLDRSAGAGALVKGRAADVVLAALTGGPGRYALRVKHTFVAGHRVV